jgi:hypothetical protein
MQYKIRNFHEEMPPEGFCGLCNLKDAECKCIKHKCECDILSLNCEWPNCLCLNCDNFKKKCACNHVQQ